MPPVSSTLHDAAVAAVLARLRAQADSEDAPAKVRVAAQERELGRKIYGRERADAYGGAPLAISAEVGRLLYVLAVARRRGPSSSSARRWATRRYTWRRRCETPAAGA